MDIEKIRQLVDLVNETGIAEIEIKEGTESVRIARGVPVSMPAYMQDAPPSTVALKSVKTPLAPAPETPHATPEMRTQNTLPPGHIVKSPMVGTIYFSPSPNAKTFVELGSTVKLGETLCVIEAMKMFNQIESDTAGKVVAVLVENGQPVEFDQPLFVIAN